MSFICSKVDLRLFVVVDDDEEDEMIDQREMFEAFIPFPIL
jgi:hypothetical protein